MGEEVSNKTETESHSAVVDSVPPLQEKESDKPDPSNENVTSPSPPVQSKSLTLMTVSHPAFFYFLALFQRDYNIWKAESEYEFVY